MLTLEVERYGIIKGRQFSFGDGVTAIVGGNGSGKSTLLDAIVYAMYGVNRFSEPSNVKLLIDNDGLAIFERSRAGKNTKVEVTLPGEGVLTQHRRALEVMLQNGWLSYEQAAITWFGKQQHLGFLGLSARDRRLVVEELLRLDVWDSAVETAKRKRQEAQRGLETARGRLQQLLDTQKSLEERARSIGKELEALPPLDGVMEEPPPYTIEQVEQAEAELAGVVEELDSLQSEVAKAESHLNEVRGRLEFLDETLARLSKELTRADDEAKALTLAIEVVDTETPCTNDQKTACPFVIAALGQARPDRERLAELTTLREVLERDLKEAAKRRNELHSDLASGEKALVALKQRVKELERRRARLLPIVEKREQATTWTNEQRQKREMQERRSKLEASLQTLEATLEQARADSERVEKSIEALTREYTTWTEAVNDLGPKGVRHHLLISALPQLAQRANDVLLELGAPFQVGFRTEKELTKGGRGETLDVMLVRDGVEVDASTASGGERVLADLAFRLALMDAYRGAGWKVPSLLVLDETLAPLDAERRVTVLSGLRKLGIESIVLTSHVEEVADYADYVVEVKR